jgi:hypothetical protein
VLEVDSRERVRSPRYRLSAGLRSQDGLRSPVCRFAEQTRREKQDRHRSAERASHGQSRGQGASRSGYRICTDHPVATGRIDRSRLLSLCVRTQKWRGAWRAVPGAGRVPA